MIYHFDIQVSDHDSLRRGIVAKRLPGAQEDFHRIVIEADDDDEAHVLAAQMAAARGDMVTSVPWRI